MKTLRPIFAVILINCVYLTSIRATAATTTKIEKIVNTRLNGNISGPSFLRNNLTDTGIDFIYYSGSTGDQLISFEEVLEGTNLHFISGTDAIKQIGATSSIFDAFQAEKSLSDTPILCFHLISLDPKSGELTAGKNQQFLIGKILASLGQQVKKNSAQKNYAHRDTLQSVDTTAEQINVIVLSVETNFPLKLVPKYIEEFVGKLANHVLIVCFTDPSVSVDDISAEKFTAKGFRPFKINVTPRGGTWEKDWDSLSSSIASHVRVMIKPFNLYSVRSMAFGSTLKRRFKFEYSSGRIDYANAYVSTAGSGLLAKQAIIYAHNCVVDLPPASMFLPATKLSALLPTELKQNFEAGILERVIDRFNTNLKIENFSNCRAILQNYRTAVGISKILVDSMDRSLVNAVEKKVTQLIEGRRFPEAKVLVGEFIPTNEGPVLMKRILYEEVLVNLRGDSLKVALEKAEKWHIEYVKLASLDDLNRLSLAALIASTAQKDGSDVYGGAWFKRLKSGNKVLTPEVHSAMLAWLTQAENLAELIDKVLLIGDLEYCRRLLRESQYHGKHWLEFALGEGASWKNVVLADFVGSKSRDHLILLSLIYLCEAYKPIANLFAKAYKIDPVLSVSALNDTTNMQLQEGWRHRVVSLTVVESDQVPYKKEFVEQSLAANPESVFFARRDVGGKVEKTQYFVYKALGNGKFLRCVLNENLGDDEFGFFSDTKNWSNFSSGQIASRIQFSIERDVLLMLTNLYSRLYSRFEIFRDNVYILSDSGPFAKILNTDVSKSVSINFFDKKEGDGKIKTFGLTAGQEEGLSERREIDFVNPAILDLAAPALVCTFGSPLVAEVPGTKQKGSLTKMYGSIYVRMKHSSKR